jgi:hypothetical protein
MPTIGRTTRWTALNYHPKLNTSGLKSPALDGSLYNLSSESMCLSLQTRMEVSNASVKFNSRVWIQAVNFRYATWFGTRLSLQVSVSSVFNGNASIKSNSRVWTQAINLLHVTWFQVRLSPFKFLSIPSSCSTIQASDTKCKSTACVFYYYFWYLCTNYS